MQQANIVLIIELKHIYFIQNSSITFRWSYSSKIALNCLFNYISWKSNIYPMQNAYNFIGNWRCAKSSKNHQPHFLGLIFWEKGEDDIFWVIDLGQMKEDERSILST